MIWMDLDSLISDFLRCGYEKRLGSQTIALAKAPKAGLIVGTSGTSYFFRRAVGPASQILDGDDMERVQGYDFSFAVHHSKRARSNQDILRMPDSVFPAIRGAQTKRVKPTT